MFGSRRRFRYHNLSWGHNQTCVVTTTGRVTRITACVPLAKVQSLRRVQGPAQRRLRLATIHLDTAGRNIHRSETATPRKQTKHSRPDQPLPSCPPTQTPPVCQDGRELTYEKGRPQRPVFKVRVIALLMVAVDWSEFMNRISCRRPFGLVNASVA